MANAEDLQRQLGGVGDDSDISPSYFGVATVTNLAQPLGNYADGNFFSVG